MTAFLLTLAAFLAPAGNAWAAEPCMSPKVGDALSAKIQAHAFDGALPGGWTFERVNVFGDRIELGVSDDRARPLAVTLRLKHEAQGLADGSGKWFVFFVDAGGQALEDASRQSLVRLAALVDAAVPEDEAMRRCSAAVQGDVGTRAALLPRWAALAFAICETLVVAGAIVFVHRRRKARGEPRQFRPLEQLLLFGGVLAAVHALAGPGAQLWLDTINDQRDVTFCLAGDGCTSLGEATSIKGMYHAVAWLQLRSLAAFTGLGIDQVHWLLQLLDAAGAVLVASAVARAGGRALGLLAAGAYLYWSSIVANHLAVYNTRPLPLLGAVLLVVGAEAAENPSAGAFAFTALVAAVTANVHAAAVAVGISVVWIALLAPQDKARFAALTAAVFAATTFAIAPASWIANADYAWRRLHAASPTHASQGGTGLASGGSYAILFAIGVVALLLGRRRARPRPMVIDVAAAIALPVLFAGLMALATSTLPMNVKYLAHTAGALAILSVTPFVPLLEWTRSLGAKRFPRIARPIDTVLPFLAAVVLGAFGAKVRGRAVAPLTFRDLEPLPRELEKRGWTYAHVYRSLKSPEDAIILNSFEILAPAYPMGPAGDDPTNAYVLKTRTAALPNPLPPDWFALGHTSEHTTLLALTRASLDWNRFAVCNASSETEPCIPSGLALAADKKPQCTYCVPGMPPVVAEGPRKLELRVPLRQTSSAETHMIVMPRWDHVCGGRILGITGLSASISDDGHRATWISATDPAAHEARLAWDIESPECRAPRYSGFPPFILEGSAETVRLLDGLGP